MKFRIVVCAALLLIVSSISQAKFWRGIVPLKSTRADVERLLGKPDGLGRYQFEDERAYIRYAEKPCAQAVDCVCIAPRDTVLDIFVTVEVEMKFSKLNIDIRDYEKQRSRHLPTYVSFSNADEGVVYTVAGDEVTEIIYLPAAKDCQALIRQNRKAKRQTQKLRN